MHYWYSDMPWGGGLGMWLFWIVLLVVIIILVKMILPLNNNSVSAETPLDILKKRYAKGEIDQETYESMKKTLES